MVEPEGPPAVEQRSPVAEPEAPVVEPEDAAVEGTVPEQREQPGVEPEGPATERRAPGVEPEGREVEPEGSPAVESNASPADEQETSRSEDPAVEVTAPVEQQAPVVRKPPVVEQQGSAQSEGTVVELTAPTEQKAPVVEPASPAADPEATAVTSVAPDVEPLAPAPDSEATLQPEATTTTTVRPEAAVQPEPAEATARPEETTPPAEQPAGAVQAETTGQQTTATAQPEVPAGVQQTSTAPPPPLTVVEDLAAFLNPEPAAQVAPAAGQPASTAGQQPPAPLVVSSAAAAQAVATEPAVTPTSTPPPASPVAQQTPVAGAAETGTPAEPVVVFDDDDVLPANPALYADLSQDDGNQGSNLWYWVGRPPEDIDSFVRIEQFCAVLATRWLNTPTPEPAPNQRFADLDETERNSAVNTLIAWNGAADGQAAQVEWVHDQLDPEGARRPTSEELVNLLQAGELGAGDRIWLATGSHATAVMMISPTEGFFYEPNTGRVERLSIEGLTRRFVENTAFVLAPPRSA